jgi:hypothetical protein
VPSRLTQIGLKHARTRRCGAPYAQPIDASPLSWSAEVPPGQYYYFVVKVDPDNANEHTACFGQNSRYNVDSETLEEVRSNGGGALICDTHSSSRPRDATFPVLPLALIRKVRHAKRRDNNV